jgi:nucleoside-diphosphate-sugar epimerase
MPKPLAHERILVTGGTGFLGSHLLRALVDAGCSPVATTRSLNRLGPAKELGSAVRWVEADLNDPQSLEQLRAEGGSQLVFHLAGVRVPDRQENAAELNWQGNVVATENLLRALPQGGEIERFITVGSAEEYGAKAGAMREEDAPQPVTSYGKAKAQATAMVSRWASDHSLRAVVLRPFSIYGPAQPPQMFIAQAVEHAVSGRSFAMTEGTQKRDLVYVADVVRALMSAVTAVNGVAEVINVGSGQAHSLREVAESIWQLSGTKAELQVGMRSAPPEELHDTWADISRAREWLNWEPLVDLDEGLRRTIAWERARQSGNASPDEK